MVVIHDTKRVNDKKWILTVQENGKTKELYIEFPQDVLDQVGWSEGDDLEWIENKDGSWAITKKENK
jgi:bifunctional DNA-binding transcriptional regulator/antitoxin component of YhaV-PrlF toxin-antitoxin module